MMTHGRVGWGNVRTRTDLLVLRHRSVVTLVMPRRLHALVRLNTLQQLQLHVQCLAVYDVIERVEHEAQSLVVVAVDLRNSNTLPSKTSHAPSYPVTDSQFATYLRQ